MYTRSYRCGSCIPTEPTYKETGFITQVKYCTNDFISCVRQQIRTLGLSSLLSLDAAEDPNKFLKFYFYLNSDFNHCNFNKFKPHKNFQV